jgi:hypothetical protein
VNESFVLLLIVSKTAKFFHPCSYFHSFFDSQSIKNQNHVQVFILTFGFDHGLVRRFRRSVFPVAAHCSVAIIVSCEALL